MSPMNLRAKCMYYDCPNNVIGLCKTIYLTIKGFCFLYHSFDGKNYIKCLCG